MTKQKYIILFSLAPIVIFLDQLTKILAIKHLKPLLDKPLAYDRFVTVIDGFFRLKYTENPGAAWGKADQYPRGAGYFSGRGGVQSAAQPDRRDQRFGAVPPLIVPARSSGTADLPRVCAYTRESAAGARSGKRPLRQ